MDNFKTITKICLKLLCGQGTVPRWMTDVRYYYTAGIAATGDAVGAWLHFAWVVDDPKCIVVTHVCLCVCLRPHVHTTAQTGM